MHIFHLLILLEKVLVVLQVIFAILSKTNYRFFRNSSSWVHHRFIIVKSHTIEADCTEWISMNCITNGTHGTGPFILIYG